MSMPGPHPSLLLQRMNYLWRLLATGFCFFVFWHGGLFLGWIILPLTRKRHRGASSELACRRRVHQSLGLFLRLMEVSGVLNVTVNGKEHLKNTAGALIMANHPTLIDFIAIVGLVPEVNCLVKDELRHHFFVKNVVNMAGYIANDDPEIVIDTATAQIKNGGTLVVFPEGTRSHQGGLRKFRRGAAAIAASTSCPVIPIVITMNPPTLMKGQKWYHIPQQKAHLTLNIHPSVNDWSVDILNQPRTLAARRLNHVFREFFKKELLHARTD